MSSSRRAQDTSQQTPAAGLKVTLPDTKPNEITPVLKIKVK